jgi:hypothetical protein
VIREAYQVDRQGDANEPVLVQQWNLIAIAVEGCFDHARRPLLKCEGADVLPRDDVGTDVVCFRSYVALGDRVSELAFADAEQPHDLSGAIDGLAAREEFDDPFTVGVRVGGRTRRSLQDTCSYLDRAAFW